MVMSDMTKMRRGVSDLNLGVRDVLFLSILKTFETGGLEGEVLQEVHLVSPKD